MNYHISPMENMRRHFSEKTYRHGYRVAKRAYRLGGIPAIENILIIIGRSKVFDGKHGYNENGIRRFVAGVESFLASKK